MQANSLIPGTLLAINAAAIQIMATWDCDVAVDTSCGCPTVRVAGILQQGTYAAIVAATEAACRTAPGGPVVLRLSTPGGAASGLFSAIESIAKASADNSCRLFAYCDGECSSAGYALATAAGTIVASPEAVVGSIGVITEMWDFTQANAAEGRSVALVTSGERKSDGNPNAGLTPEALASRQSIVDHVAALFFRQVELSRNFAPDTARLFQGASMSSVAAKSAGLVDDVLTIGALISLVQAPVAPAPLTAIAEQQGEEPMEKDKLLAALRALAEGGDDDATKMLAALSASTDDASAEKTDDKAEEKKDGDKAEEKKDGDKAPDSAALAAVSTELKLVRQSVVDSTERTQLFAARADLDPTIRGLILTEPIETARRIASVQRGASTLPGALAAITGTVAPVSGGNTGACPSVSQKSQLDEQLDRAMGLSANGPTLKDSDTTQFFSAFKAPGVRARAF